MRCDRCLRAQPLREAALRPQAAAEYPFLPARMWTAAARVADIVATYRGIPGDMVDRLHRLLSDRDFVFRGGSKGPNRRIQPV
jgi:hypothetical protein